MEVMGAGGGEGGDVGEKVAGGGVEDDVGKS